MARPPRRPATRARSVCGCLCPLLFAAGAAFLAGCFFFGGAFLVAGDGRSATGRGRAVCFTVVDVARSTCTPAGTGSGVFPGSGAGGGSGAGSLATVST